MSSCSYTITVSEPSCTLPCCPGRRRKEDLHGLDVHMIDTMQRYIRRASAGDVMVIISGTMDLDAESECMMQLILSAIRLLYTTLCFHGLLMLM
jgi:hypothetical protein